MIFFGRANANVKLSVLISGKQLFAAQVAVIVVVLCGVYDKSRVAHAHMLSIKLTLSRLRMREV